MSCDYTNHLMTCKQCFDNLKRYCPDGIKFKVESYSSFFADALVKLDVKNKHLSDKQQSQERVLYLRKHAIQFLGLPNFEKTVKEKYRRFRQEDLNHGVEK